MIYYLYIGLLFIIFYVLFIYLFIFMFYSFVYLFCFIFYFFNFLASTRSEFLLRGVSIYILVCVNLFIDLFIWGAPWGRSFLVQFDANGMQFDQQ